jgi:predicted NACHT family NTPase
MQAMPSQDDIQGQQSLLEQHRRTLQVYLEQRAALGKAHISPGVANGIDDARRDIRRIKVYLRNWEIAVEDLPNDEEDQSSRELPALLQSAKNRLDGLRPDDALAKTQLTLDLEWLPRAVHSSASYQEEALSTQPINVFDAFKASTGFLLILGSGGIGKTTLMAKLGMQIIDTMRSDRGDPIPVLLRLTRLKPNKPALFPWSVQKKLSEQFVDWLVAALRKEPHFWRTKHIDYQELIKQARFLFLLDGLDEIADITDRRACIRAINVSPQRSRAL